MMMGIVRVFRWLLVPSALAISSPLNTRFLILEKPMTSGKVVKFLFVGMFYCALALGVDNFADVGKWVKKGDTLCIIEAMKLMNEIEAEFDGVIKEILAENEQLVEFDQPLFVIE